MNSNHCVDRKKWRGCLTPLLGRKAMISDEKQSLRGQEKVEGMFDTFEGSIDEQMFALH